MLKKRGWIFLLLLILLFSGCDLIYGLLYTEFTITIVNSTSQDITEVTVSKGSLVKITDTTVLASSQSRDYKVNERDTYTISGILPDSSTFSESIDFTDKEKITIKVE